MVCETAEEVHARLALRALWPREEEDGDSAASPPATLQRAMCDDMEATLKGSLERRMARLRRAVEQLGAAAGGADLTGAGPPAGAPEAADTALLAQAAAKALRAATAAARPLRKVYGPTARQRGQVDPPESDGDLLPESSVLVSTLEALEQNCGARRRQIASLRAQADKLREVQIEQAAKVAASSDRERAVRDDRNLAAREHTEVLEQRRRRVAELGTAVAQKQVEASRYKDMVRQQKRYFIQTERLSMSGGLREVNRHPTGDIAMAVPPPRIADDEHIESWDIGTAIANPYVVDSWPFEPNVLAARRQITESPMEPCNEESKEELRNELLRLPVKCTGLPLRDDEDEEDYQYEDDDDEMGGGTATARSL